MKIKHLLIGLFAAAAAVACNQEEPVETPSLELNKEAVSLAAENGEGTFTVTSNQSWVATADADWVSLEPASGEASKDAVEVTVTADPNETTEARTATVTVKAGELTKTVAVTQAAGEADEPDQPGPGENPELELSEWALVGSFTDDNNWNPASDLYLSILDENYFVYYAVELTETTEFKFLKGGAWPGTEIGGNGLVEPNTIQVAGGSNIKVTPAGTYDIYLAADLTKFYVMEAGKLPSEATEPAPVENSWSMMGCFVDNQWATDVPMTQEGEWIVAKGAQFTELTFKIRANQSWADATNIGVAPGTEKGVVNAKVSVVTAEYSKANLGGDASDIKLNGEAGTYDVYFSFEKLEVYVMEPGFKPGEKDPQTPDLSDVTYTVTGTISGNAWNNAAEIGLMVPEGDYLVAKNVPFVWDSSLYEDSDKNYIQFKVCETGTWDAYCLTQAGVMNAANTAIDVVMAGENICIEAPAGNYDVYFDKANGKVWVMNAGLTPGQTPDPNQPMFDFTELYVLGAACDTGWGIDEMTAFEKAGDVWVWEGNLKVDEFRFPLQKQSNVWWPCLVPTADGTAVFLGEGDGAANTYRVPAEGYYKLTVNPQNGALTVEHLGDRREPTIEVTELYMLGGACDTGWDLGAMEAFTNNEGVFTWTGNLKSGEKFRFPLQKVDNKWWPCLMISADGTQLVYGQGDADEVIYLIEEAGKYTITIDVRDWHNRTVSVEKYVEPEGPKVSTIASVIALGQGATIPADTFVEGIVISNKELNNLTSSKGMYIQDETAGLQFYLAANHDFNFGDKVRVELSGTQVGQYGGAVQISGLALAKIEVLSTGNAVTPKTVTIADFLANKYEGQYVAIEGVQVAKSDLSKTWLSGNAHTSINIEDANGNKFVVFSSKYASYGTIAVPQGSGTIAGIASINNGTMQLIFAQNSDYAGLTGERFAEEVVEPEPEEPGTPVAANRADFETIDGYYGQYNKEFTSADGWHTVNCAIQEGNTEDVNPQFICIDKVPGTDNWAKAVCLNGKTTASGVLESPEIAGGCGTLSFNYGNMFSESNGVSFQVEVIQNGESVKTLEFTKDKDSVSQKTKYEGSLEVNISGTFKLKFTNLCPSNSSSNKDRVSIWNLTWTNFE